MNVSLNDIALMRLVSQQLIQSRYTKAQDLVAWLGAIQAQEYAQTLWGIGLRIPNLIADDIEKEFNEGQLLRTHVLRPTWHFVSANDIHWMLALTAPRVHAVNAFMYKQTELNDALFNRSSEIIYKSLHGGKQLTREEINEEFKRHSIRAEGHRLSYLMMNAELNGMICSGAKRGNQHTYALIEERIPQTRKWSKEESLAELTKRYFQSRGPATVQDYSTWSGLTLGDCRKGIALLSNEIQTLRSEGNEYYFIPSQKVNSLTNSSMMLLPMYDEYIMGYKDRSAIFNDRNNTKPHPKSIHNCTIVWEGQVIGYWKRTVNSKALHMEYQFFKSLNSAQEKAFEHSIQELNRFTQMEVKRVI